MAVSPEEKQTIRRAVILYEQHCEQRYEDDIFELSMRLGLEENTVRRIWDDSL